MTHCSVVYFLISEIGQPPAEASSSRLKAAIDRRQQHFQGRTKNRLGLTEFARVIKEEDEPHDVLQANQDIFLQDGERTYRTGTSR